jgi:hypothetical protein
MPDRPEAITRFNTLLGQATITHGAIFDLHRRLLVRGRAGSDSAGLLAESARIATVGLPSLARPLARLATRWDEESLLDPQAADSTAREIAAKLAAVEPGMRSLLARQGEIAATLRARLG